MKNKISFPKEKDAFLRTLNKNVEDYFKIENKKKYGNMIIIKRYLILKTCIIICYLIILLSKNVFLSFALFALLGPLFIILLLNVSHDAIHGIAHSNKKINTYLKFQMDLFGANSYAWKKRHKKGHHAFPNILNKDPDLKQTVIVKIFPNANKLSFHKYQHIYVPILYSFYTINWVFVRDFKDFFTKSLIGKIPSKEFLKFFICKLLYVIIFFVIPIRYSFLSFSEVLLTNILMHIFASYFLTIALVPSHVSEKSIFPLPNNEGLMPYSWSDHQVITTSDFATKNKITTWLLGGFNHHITHHLFPSVSHIHYFELTPIVKAAIVKFELPYTHVNSLFEAYKSHYKLLKKNGSE
ncbi:acyl-CoA desaturase [Polaribacter aestuariivivens]|uniref:Acyl-CoA desaturase n=1 Tax=Polaribacter aestuariivivens TaxID=2304626 RepID=A0A5S3NA50_9FLAO|nr:acyl-CoA desaturase [Polaribacter aestuariivivens]TMM31987.1 acyl-CoA desaturase [Polaribacter aestuariivivens]